VREVLADTETPVSAFLKIGDGDYAFLLESVEHGEKWSRYSILGANPSSVYTASEEGITLESRGRVRRLRGAGDPLVELEKWHRRQRPVPLPEEEGLPPFWGGAVGFVSYDAVRLLEELPAQARDDLPVPQAAFLLMDTVVVFDNLSLTMKVIASQPVGRNPDKTYRDCVARIEALIARLRSPLPEGGHTKAHRQVARRFASDFTRRGFETAVARAKEHIRSGEAVQIVLAQRFVKKLACAPFDVYRSLRVVNPSAYMFYLKLGRRHLIGSSPEVLVRRQGERIELRPIAGTRPRGPTAAADRALAEELCADEKERAEHVMLVDLGRNDLGRVAAFGSVEVQEFMKVERYSHVMHLVSNVVGRARKGVTSLDVLRACFPAGTVTGAPKVRAMELIDSLEPVRRGIYAGAVGYLSFDGNLDTCIAIRTAHVEDGAIHIGSGAGIVADSDPRAEYRETLSKAEALFTAVAAAEGRAYDGRGWR
jgi:anthranilate synthase component 1